jgi:hypothetical protein
VSNQQDVAKNQWSKFGGSINVSVPSGYGPQINGKVPMLPPLKLHVPDAIAGQIGGPFSSSRLEIPMDATNWRKLSRDSQIKILDELGLINKTE